MKKLQQLCLAGVFTFALTTAMLAGDIATGGKGAPPPGAVTTSVQIPTNAKDEAASEFKLKDIALDLLHDVVGFLNRPTTGCPLRSTANSVGRQLRSVSGTCPWEAGEKMNAARLNPWFATINQFLLHR